MAIQHRRGSYNDFDPQKMKPAEIAVVQSNDPLASDGKAVYVAFQAGNVKRLATTTDIQDAVANASTEIAQEIRDSVADDVQRAESAASSVSASAEQIETNRQNIATNTNDISDLKDELGFTGNTYATLHSDDLENGALNENGINTTSMSYRLRTKEYIETHQATDISINVTSEKDIFFYAMSYTKNDYATPATANMGWQRSGNVELPSGTKYIRLVFSINKTSEDISPSDISSVVIKNASDSALENVVQTIPQALTEDKKAQARENIDVETREELAQSLSGNFTPIDTFTVHVNPTTYTTTPDSVYMKTTKNLTYTNTSTPKGYLKNVLISGRKYRLHARLDSFSGNPFKTVAIRGNESGVDNIAHRLDFNQVGEEKEIDFIATGYEDYLSLFLTGSSAAPNAEIQYSNIWLKEVKSKKEIDEDNLFNGGFCPTFLVKIADGALESQTSSASKATDYIAVDSSTDYLMKNNYYSSQGIYGLAFYDSAKNYISGIEISPSRTSRKLTCKFFTPNTAKYIRFSFWADTKENLTNLIYLSKYSEESERAYGEKCAILGEKLNLKSQSVVSILSKFNTSEYGVPQGGDISNNMLFGFSNNLLKNFVIDMSTFEIKPVLYSGATVDNHANCVSFGNTKYDSSDVYPIIYISSERGRYIGVFRIVITNEQYSIVEMSRISFPEAVSDNYGNALIDAMNEKIYLTATMSAIYPESRLYEYKLPTSLSENITLDSVPYDINHPYGYTSSTPYVYKFLGQGAPYTYTQDGFIYNEKLYRTCGGEGAAVLNVINIADGRNITFINLSTVIPYEPEITAKSDGKIIVVSANGVIYSMLDY